MCLRIWVIPRIMIKIGVPNLWNSVYLKWLIIWLILSVAKISISFLIPKDRKLHGPLSLFFSHCGWISLELQLIEGMGRKHKVLLSREFSFIPICLALTLESDHWPPSYRILNTTLFESWEMIGPYPSWWLFNGLLLILQVLHVIWSYLIARIAFKALIRGKVRMKDGFFLWGWVGK